MGSKTWTVYLQHNVPRVLDSVSSSLKQTQCCGCDLWQCSWSLSAGPSSIRSSYLLAAQTCSPALSPTRAFLWTAPLLPPPVARASACADWTAPAASSFSFWGLNPRQIEASVGQKFTVSSVRVWIQLHSEKHAANAPALCLTRARVYSLGLCFSFLFVVFCKVQLQKHLPCPLITLYVLLLVLIPLSHSLWDVFLGSQAVFCLGFSPRRWPMWCTLLWEWTVVNIAPALSLSLSLSFTALGFVITLLLLEVNGTGPDSAVSTRL